MLAMNAEQQILVKRLIEGELSTQRFLKVGKPGCEPDKDKAAFESEWEKHLYGPEDLDGFPRWGICGKDYLVLIDSDKRQLYDYLSKVLPNTFEVTSPRHGLPHKYLIVCGEQVPNGVFHIPGDLDEKGRKNKCGEVRAENQYLVAPGTTIRYQDLKTGEWKTGQYIVTNNVPIARMEYADFMAAIKPYMNPEDDSQKLTAEDIEHGVSVGERHNKASRYADHLIGHRKLDAETALYELRNWDQKLNNPPINDDEYLKRCVRDALTFLSRKTGISKQQLAIHGAIANPLKTPIKTLPEPDPIMLKTWCEEDLLSYTLKDLDLRVKHDRTVKTSVFATGLSAFTDEPINLFLKGTSSVGKTYNTVETLKYWPEDVLWFLGGMSRKSLQHDYGILKSANGEPVDMDEWPLKPRSRDFEDSKGFKEAMQNYHNEIKAKKEELKGSYTEVYLWHKILVFLEPPDFQTFMASRPILSHDKREMTYRFVDKSKSGPMKTVVVKLVGWPATVFLTVDRQYIEELATRGFTTTPEDNPEKLKAANVLTTAKVSEPWEFNTATEAMKTINALIQHLKMTVDDSEKPISVVIPFGNLDELFPSDIPRDMRDYKHFTQLVQALTVFYYFQRPYMKLNGDEWLISTVQDVKIAYGIYKDVFETTRTGIDKKTLEFYWKVVVLHKDGAGLETLTNDYIKLTKRTISSKSVDRLCVLLDDIGYLDKRQDPEDKRKNKYVPLQFDAEKQTNLDKSEMSISLSSKMEKGFDSWLTRCRQTSEFYKCKNAEALSHANLRAIILKNNFSFCETNSCLYLVKAESPSEPQKKPKDIDKRDLSTFVHNSDLFSCPFCASKGKQILFASELDLKQHCEVFHGES